MIVARFVTGAVWLSFMGCAGYQAEGRGRPAIELRIASDSVKPGFMPMNAISDTVFYVDQAPVVSDSDIQMARVSVTRDVILIRAGLTKSANSRYVTVTNRHVGERLALIVDGQLIAAPPIVAPPIANTTSRLDLEIGGLADSTTQRIKALIIGRWPADSQ